MEVLKRKPGRSVSNGDCSATSFATKIEKVYGRSDIQLRKYCDQKYAFGLWIRFSYVS